jgi:hypothetical protein
LDERVVEYQEVVQLWACWKGAGIKDEEKWNKGDS